MEKLTPKQENFCQQYLLTGNASEAYRRSYDSENMKPETINRKAKDLLDNGKITARVGELQEVAREALIATLELKKSMLIDIARFNCEKVDTEDGKGSQRNPQAAIAALRELNLMDGDHAAVRSKIEVAEPEHSRDEAAMEYARKSFNYEQAKQLHELTFVQKMSNYDAVEMIKSEMKTKGAI